MSGNCYSCGSGFSFFKKELGCKNCGFAFCKECIHSKKAPVPKLKNEKHKVCHKCFNILTGKVKPVDNSGKYSPPEAYKKRLAALEAKQSAPKQSPSQGASKPSPRSYPKSMGKEDIAIAERLEKLKDSRKPDPKTLPNEKQIEDRLAEIKGDRNKCSTSASDIAARAAQLQGKDPQAAAAKHTGTSSGRGEVDDLMNQVMEEVELDNITTERFDEVEQRLARLKGQDMGKKSGARPKTPDLTKFQTDAPTENGAKKDDDIEAIINEVAAELEVDAQKAVDDLMKDKAIREKLDQIKAQRGKSKGPDETTGEDENGEKDDSTVDSPEKEEESEDEEEAIKKIIQQAIEEQKLDEEAERAELGLDEPRNEQAPGALGPPPTRPQMDEFEEEFPWCCICNEDATMRCQGCDDDLYCQCCFREGHDRFEMGDHKTSPIKKKSQKS